ncbi:hypothetical protein MRY82_02525 [bacterium]|nr:hypothetical protein [bacterium]
MKRFLSLALVLLVSSSVAQTQITAKSGNVNIRNIPSTKDTATEKTKVVGSIDDRGTYMVEGRQEDATGRLWYKISEGWVAGWLVSEVKQLSIHGDETSTSSNDASYDDSVYTDSSDGDSSEVIDSSAAEDTSAYDDASTMDDSSIDDVMSDDESSE